MHRSRCRGFAGGAGGSVFILALAAGLFCVPLLSAADQAVPSSYEEELVSASEELRLWEEPYWLRLVHYKKSITGMKSLVDDPKFFLAADGRKNPRTELLATLRALFLPVIDEAKHVLCRFPARSAYLIERLAIDKSRLSAAGGCSRMDAIMREIRPRSVSLIFPPITSTALPPCSAIPFFR